MSSELFNHINIPSTASPILLDQITFKVPIYTTNKERAYQVVINNDTRKKHRIESLNHPVVSYFADPRLYPCANGNVIHPCGRKVIASGGKRIVMAEQGTPLGHCQSVSRAPQEASIGKHEHISNQFTDAELTALLKNPKCDPANPYQYQLEIVLLKLEELKKVVVEQKSLQRFNNISLPIFAKALERMELYLEIPFKGDDDKALKAACEKALTIAFGEAKLKMYNVQDVIDGEDRDPAFLKWQVSQRMLSPELNGKSKDCFIKFYKKGQRIRLEIQVRKPHRKKSMKQEFDDFIKRGGNTPLVFEAMAIADIIASCLRTIERHAGKVLSEIPAQTQSSVFYQQMQERCRVLISRKADSMNLLNALRYIADNGFIDKKTYRSFGLNVQNLSLLADTSFGFLKVQQKGLISGQVSKRAVNPTYILVPEWLCRSGKPIVKSMKSRLALNQFQYVNSYKGTGSVEDAIGSAKILNQSAILLGA